MTLNDVLLSLLEPLGATGGAHFVGWDTVRRWPDHALGKMLEAGILAPAKASESVECRGCEKGCSMDVRHLPGVDGKPERVFVVCEDPEMQGQMGRIAIPPEQLRRWKVTALQLARAVSGLLATEGKAEDRRGQGNIRIGMMRGRKGRRWISLNKAPLALETNGHKVPLEELLFFEGDALAIDRARIDRLVDAAPVNAGKGYTPSTQRRESRKRQTEAMYEDWRDAYRELRRKHPSTVLRSDNWIAMQIAKRPIAQGRSSETIRRIIKS